ncbi:hypothetical protein RugamoR64_33250 [Duganella rhizosphaerae]|uniref:hypothetical protein n=1 Tax=Duganella rhizosphaerae TaxID=2885763 RepID=UPI0030E8AB2F
MTTPITPLEEIANLQQEVVALKQLLADEELKLKKVEYYAASTNAWFNTSLEFDKSMFALSGGGIALLVSLMSNVKTIPMLLLYIAAIVCFIVCIGLLLAVFQKNKTYVMQLAQNQHADASLLDALDSSAAIIFGLAVVLTVVLGIAVAMQGLKLN